MSTMVLENELSSLNDRLITILESVSPKNKGVSVAIFQGIQVLSFVGITFYKNHK